MLVFKHVLLLVEIALVSAQFVHPFIVRYGVLGLGALWLRDCVVEVKICLFYVVNIMHGFVIHDVINVLILLCPIPFIFKLFFSIVVEMSVPLFSIKTLAIIFHFFLLIPFCKMLFLVHYKLDFLLLLIYLIFF